MITRITIRFTDEEKSIHNALTKSAQKNRRSLNAEMLRAFEFYLQNATEAKPVGKEVSKKKSKSP
jgi:hypothetical protein